MSADTSTPPPSETPAYDALTKKQREWIELYFTMGRNQTAVSRSMGYKAPEKHGARMSQNVGVQAAIAERLAELRIEANDVLYRIGQRAEATAEDFLRFDVVERRPMVRVPVEDAIERLTTEIEDEEALQLPSEAKAAVEALGAINGLRRRLSRFERLAEREPEATVLVRGDPVEVEVARFDLARMRDAGKLHLVKSVTKNADGSQKVELHDAAKADEMLGKHLGLFTEKIDLTTGGEPLREIRVSIATPRRRGE